MNDLLIKALVGLVAALSALIPSLQRSVNPPTLPVAITSAPLFGTTNFSPVQAQRFILSGSGSGLTDTSITLTQMKLPDGTTNITMSNFGSIGYGTLEPGTSKEEQISFTGISQNGNGSATLTGVSRGLAFVSPFTASTTLRRTHAGGSIFVISNTAAFYSNFLSGINDATITSRFVYSSTTPPRYDLNPASFSAFPDTTFASLSYVNSVASAGAATATESVTGLVRLATRLQQASSTDAGPSIPLVLQAKYATSSPIPFSGSGNNYAVITRDDGRIDPNFVATTTSDVYRFGGPVVFNTSTTTFNAGTVISGATSTAPLCINGLCAGWPTSSASSSILMTTGGSNADVTWSPEYNRRLLSKTGNVTVSNTASTTLMTVSIPGGTMGQNSVIHGHANLSGYGTGNTGPNDIAFGLLIGSSRIGYASSTPQSAVSNTNGGTLDFYISSAGSLTSQDVDIVYNFIEPDRTITPIGGKSASNTQTSSFNAASTQTLTLEVRQGSASGQVIFNNGYIEIIH